MPWRSDGEVEFARTARVAAADGPVPERLPHDALAVIAASIRAATVNVMLMVRVKLLQKLFPRIE